MGWQRKAELRVRRESRTSRDIETNLQRGNTGKAKAQFVRVYDLVVDMVQW